MEPFAELARLRERAGITKRQLSTAAGVSESTLWRWEAGDCKPRSSNMRHIRWALAKLVNMRIDYMAELYDSIQAVDVPGDFVPVEVTEFRPLRVGVAAEPDGEALRKLGDKC